jgi:hypothetical protein
VLKGAVEVNVKDQNIKVTDRRALALSVGGKLKAQDYDTLRYEDNFFRWSALRSGYLSEAGSTRPVLTSAQALVGMVPAGTARAGIGILCSVPGHSFWLIEFGQDQSQLSSNHPYFWLSSGYGRWLRLWMAQNDRSN